MNNMFKSSDLLKELAPSQGDGCVFIYLSHMVERINMIQRWSPVSGKFGHLQEYLRRSRFIKVDAMHLAMDEKIMANDRVFVLLPSFEDFRAFALAEYVDALPEMRGLWGKLSRFLRSDYLRGYHAFISLLILQNSALYAYIKDDKDALATFISEVSDTMLRYEMVKVGRIGVYPMKAASAFRAFKHYGLSETDCREAFNAEAKRFTVLPFGPIVSDIEHVFRINSVTNSND